MNFFCTCITVTAVLLTSVLQYLQELIRNKARNGQNCCLLEEAYAMVSALPQRSENTHHVSMIENYPATLEVLGEPMRQVGGVTVAFLINTLLFKVVFV